MKLFYLVTVSEGGRRIERAIFYDQCEALYFVEKRRKQGYYVEIDIKTFLEPDKFEEDN